MYHSPLNSVEKRRGNNSRSSREKRQQNANMANQPLGSQLSRANKQSAVANNHGRNVSNIVPALKIDSNKEGPSQQVRSGGNNNLARVSRQDPTGDGSVRMPTSSGNGEGLNQ